MTTQQTNIPAGRTLLRAAVRLTLPLCALSLLSGPALAYSLDTSRLAGTDVIRSVPAPTIGELVGAADPLRMQVATEYTLEQQLKGLSRYYQQHPNEQPPAHLVPLLQQYRERTSTPRPRAPQTSPPVFPTGTRASLPPPVFPIGTRASLPPPVFPTGTRAGLQPTQVQPSVRQFAPFPQRFQQPAQAPQAAPAVPVVPQSRRAATAPAPRAIPQALRSRAVAAPLAAPTPPAIPSSNPTGPVYSPGSSARGSNVAQQGTVQQGARSLGNLKREMDARKAAAK